MAAPREKDHSQACCFYNRSCKHSILRYTPRCSKQLADAALPATKHIKNRGDDTVRLHVLSPDLYEDELHMHLQFAAPDEFHCPAQTNLPSAVSLARRVAALMRCTRTVSTIWSTAATYTIFGLTDRSVAQLTSLKDAEARAQAAVRSGAQLHAARLQCIVGTLYYNYGELIKTIEYFTNALSSFDLQRHTQGVAFCYSVLGCCYFRKGEYKVSLSLEKQLQTMCGSYGRAVAAINIGLCYFALDEFEQAHAAFNDALQNSLSASEPLLECIALRNIGLVSMHMNRLNDALTLLERSLEVYSTLSNKKGAALCLVFLGKTHELLHNYEHALFFYEHAFQIAGEANNADIVSVARVSIGSLKGQAALNKTMLDLASQLGCTHDATAIVRLLSS